MASSFRYLPSRTACSFICLGRSYAAFSLTKEVPKDLARRESLPKSSLAFVVLPFYVMTCLSLVSRTKEAHLASRSCCSLCREDERSGENWWLDLMARHPGSRTCHPDWRDDVPFEGWSEPRCTLFLQLLADPGTDESIVHQSIPPVQPESLPRRTVGSASEPPQDEIRNHLMRLVHLFPILGPSRNLKPWSTPWMLTYSTSSLPPLVPGPGPSEKGTIGSSVTCR